MKKRYFSLLLAAVLVFSLMAVGCGDKTPDGSDPASNPDSSQTDNSTTSSSAADPTGDATDDSTTTGTDTTTSGDKATLDAGNIFGTTTGKTTTGKTTTKTTGKTTAATQKTNLTTDEEKMYSAAKKYLGNLIDTKKVDGQTVTILSGTTFAQEDVLLNAFNVKIEYTQVDSVINRYITRVDSGDSPDMLWYDMNSALIVKGYVQAWDKYIDFKDKMYSDITGQLDLFKMGGRHYFVHSGGGTQQILLFHTAAFKEISEKNPYELMLEGKWDWDTLKKLMKKLSKDENNDGKLEQYPLGEISNNAFVYATGSDYITFKNGQPVNMLSTPEISRAVNTHTELIQKHNLRAHYNDIIPDFESGKLAMVIGERWQLLANYMDEFDAGKIGWCYAPKDPEADAHYVANETPGFYLSKGAQHPEAAAAWMMVERWSAWDKEAVKLSRRIAQKDGRGLSDKYWEVYDNLNKIIKPTQLTWAWMNIATVMSEINDRSLAGESWSKIQAECSPKIDAQIKLFKKNLG